MGRPGLERERRLVFGEDAERYDRARPSYPAALIDDVVGLVGPRAGSGARVIDVGCGTGKGTRLLADRGMVGVGVEAHPAMAAVARAHLPEGGWRVDVSDFESWSPAPGDTPADLVTAAQAWHWVEPSKGLRKAHDLLRPEGWLAMWWNLADDDPSEVRQEIEAVYAEHAPGERFCPSLERAEASPFEPRRDRPGFDPDPDYPRFGPAIHRLYHWRLTYTTDQLLDLLGTHSNHRMMEPDRRERLLAAVADVVDRHGGTYDNRYVCQLWAAPRT
jgi:SAM-dependent methyltransferase